MGKNSIENLQVGQLYVKNFVVSEKMGEEFAKISQDYNPIHLNGDAAAQTRFGRKIVHGMLIGSYFSGIIGNEFPGAGSVYISQEIIFKSPVYYDTDIEIKIEVTEINLIKKHVTLKTQCYNQDGKLLVDGNAKILLE